jgi:mannitol/fructose-specific phosphotransferase system IIA component (Ntr-type)
MVSAGVPKAPYAPLDVVELKNRRRESVLVQLVTAAQAAGTVRDPDALLATLGRAQKLASFAIGHGCAVAHARSLTVMRAVMVFGRSGRGIDWEADDGPVQLVLLVLSPAASSLASHADRVLAAVHALRLQRTRQKLLDAGETAVRTLLAEAST